MAVTEGFWRGRRVLLTGHTGFKGAWLRLWLTELGAEVTGLALAPATQPNLYELFGAGERSLVGDIRDAGFVAAAVADSDPEVVIHMAAQALVRESYRAPVVTFATNIMGTVHVLEACRTARSLRCILVVTSDKVYENDGAGRPFAEGDRLGGHDPYSNSKACTELVTASYRDSFFSAGPPLATARAGNVIGGGDWSADRLVPDCVRAWLAGEAVRVRYPDAVRPWQHVFDPLCGYLALAEALAGDPAGTPHAVNFGPDPSSFVSVSELIRQLNGSFPEGRGFRQEPGEHPPEARTLALSSSLARGALGWRPRLPLSEGIAWTGDWYRAHRAGEDMREFSRRQLAAYRRLT